jgi:hypothetical protein
MVAMWSPPKRTVAFRRMVISEPTAEGTTGNALVVNWPVCVPLGEPMFEYSFVPAAPSSRMV